MPLEVLGSLLLFSVTTACSSDNNDELIVGKWYVQSVRHVTDDHTAGTHNDYTIHTTDTNYIGYDSVEFYADGTMRWHRNDRYMHDGMYREPNKYYSWYSSNDSLFMWNGSVENRLVYEIKKLNSKTLVMEHYHNNEHEEYSHHHIEGTDCYTCQRSQ